MPLFLDGCGGGLGVNPVETAHIMAIVKTNNMRSIREDVFSWVSVILNPRVFKSENIIMVPESWTEKIEK